MPKRAFLTAAALASPALLLAPPGAAQTSAPLTWTDCRLTETLPDGAQFLYLSIVGPGAAPRPHVSWMSSAPGRPRLRLNMDYVRGPKSAPAFGHAFYHLGSPLKPVDYKVVFTFDGAGAPATMALGPGPGTSLVGNFRPWETTGAGMEGFAHARRVTATVYEGDQQIAQDTFDLAPDRRIADLDAFTRRVQANDPGICHAAAGPPLPVPPVEHRHG